MIALDKKLLNRFLTLAGDALSGEWILLGGTLLPACGIDVRSTMDIDIVGVGPKEASQNLELMGLAESLGLSVEVINQAASFFLHKIGFKKTDLMVLRRGKRSVIYRPSFELYMKLKSERLTENDLADCQAYFKFCKESKDKMNFVLMRKYLLSKVRAEKDSGRLERLRDIQRLIDS